MYVCTRDRKRDKSPHICALAQFKCRDMAITMNHDVDVNAYVCIYTYTCVCAHVCGGF